MENSYPSLKTLSYEESRLQKLNGYRFSCIENRNGAFQHVASMAARIFNAPIAFVSLVGDYLVKIEASIGLDGFKTINREESLCTLVINDEKVTVFENAQKVSLLSRNPILYNTLELQFYAGAPIRTVDGFNIGCVSIADVTPRQFSVEDAQMLEHLTTIVMSELEMAIDCC